MVKHKIEALLFSSGRKMSVEEISRLCKQKSDVVVEMLNELQKDYEGRNSSLMLVQEGDFWKITVREHHLPLVRKIVSETELSKSVIETLAVIAFKYPILQSNLIKIRTNKAYDHLKDLEEAGYITRQKRGRTKLIKLTQKFFDYFSLPEEKLKEQFQDFESIAKAIEEKERDVEEIKADQKKKAEDAKKEDERIKKEVDKVDEEHLGKLEVFEEKEVDTSKDKLGDLEIVDEQDSKDEDVAPEVIEEKEEVKEEPVEEKVEVIEEVDEKPREEEVVEEPQEEVKEEPVEKEKVEERPEISEEEVKKEFGKELPPEEEKRVQEEVDKMLHPPKEEGEDSEKVVNEEEKEKEEGKEEAKDLLEAEMEKKPSEK